MMNTGLIMGALIASIFFVLGYVVRSMKDEKTVQNDLKYEPESFSVTAPIEKNKKDIADIFRHKDGKKKGLLSYKNFIRE